MDPAKHFDVLIVGAGHGGAQLAISLRNQKFAGSIALLGSEPEFPYERPPLSKGFLSGDTPFERILIRAPEFWSEREIAVLRHCTVARVQSSEHRVVLADGTAISYGVLVWAAGGVARRLGCLGSTLRGVHTMRTRADVEKMRVELHSTRQVVVVGGGYIGLESAATLTHLGKQVTILEAQDRVLARVAAEPLSRFYENEHRAQGVVVRLGASVTVIEGNENDGVRGVRLADGEWLPADMVIVGIGIVPAVQPLTDAGAEGDNGVLVDERCRTSLADVFAIGDCALHASRFSGGRKIRLESVQNAADQAAVVARNICGNPATYSAVPWFWSQQYDLRLQTVGLHLDHDSLVVRGSPASRSFSVIYLKCGAVIALDCVNSGTDFVQGKALVAASAVVDPARLADVAIPLKSSRISAA